MASGIVSTPATRRILKELMILQKDPPISCTAGVANADDVFRCLATIAGPPDTPYSGGLFLVSIIYPEDYPHKPPKVALRTKIFHPNINSNGYIQQLDIVNPKTLWTSAITISQILLSIFSLMSDPSFEYPLVPEIADMYKTDRSKYETLARKWTQMYAMPK